MTSFTTTDPATGKTLETYERLAPQAIEEKLRDAHAAAQGWRTSSAGERASILHSVAAALRAQRETLAATAVAEMGKPIVQARAEVEKCAWCCDYFAENAQAMLEQRPAKSDATLSYAAFRPLGAILAVMPWNFPYWQVIRAAAPALMAGNVMFLKHAENTTRCGLEIERIIREAGAPAGVFTTLLVSHDDAGTMIGDSRVAAVTLTGSERAGIAVATAAGKALKKCVLELGGSDAFIVLADADLDLAAQTATKARFQNNGQSCIAAKRFIVERPVYDAFLEKFAAAAKAQTVGNPMDDATALGPVARGDLRDTLHAQVQETLEAGGELVLGGRNVERDGFFYEATIVAGVRPGMRMFDEEVFGPAAAVIRAEDASAAIALANASCYGLGSSIFTRDAERAQELAAQVEAGMVFINGMVASDPRLPFGGVKRSGYGRELSSFGIHEFVNIQTVWVR
jgi:succinate-semialdehyde dehydrogenase/glutarate-semialdehyde dehydrogenase